jgi:hypothetical protein
MHKPHFVVHRKVWLSLMLVVGTLLLGAIVVTPQAGIVTAQGPKPRGPQVALGTGFTYQGQLKSGGATVNGNCDLAFRLYDDPSSGNAIGTAMTPTVAITNGLFTTLLDFGTDAFNGDARWLDMQVGCPTGGGTFNTLVPRQQLSAAPYALFSAALCLNAISEIATCSSSLRYKNNIADLPMGLDTVMKLRPVTYDWKSNGEQDLGLVAEEVNAVAPVLTTRNKDGQIEGVKYDRLTAVLVKGIQA